MSKPDPIVLIYDAIMGTGSLGINVWPQVVAKKFGKWVFVSMGLLKSRDKFTLLNVAPLFQAKAYLERPLS